MDLPQWASVGVPVALGVVVARRARPRAGTGRTTRTLYRAVVVVVLSAFRVSTPDIERRLRAITDDAPRPRDHE